MRSAVARLTDGLFCRARETVEWETFASRAMSLIEACAHVCSDLEMAGSNSSLCCDDCRLSMSAHVCTNLVSGTDERLFGAIGRRLTTRRRLTACITALIRASRPSFKAPSPHQRFTDLIKTSQRLSEHHSAHQGIRAPRLTRLSRNQAPLAQSLPFHN